MSTKVCSRCRLELPASEFAQHHRDGLQSMCKPCNRDYQRDHYRRNRADYLGKGADWTASRRADNLTKILAYLAQHPCADCGETDPLVLHFDHTRGVKLAEVSSLYSSGSSWVRILAEIAKCDVRCAVCHCKRHARAGGWRRLAMAEDLQRVVDAVAQVQPRSDPSPAKEVRATSPRLKWCGYCAQDLPLHEYARHRQGTQSKCRACQRSYSRDHYRQNRAAYIARVRVRNRALLEANMARVVTYLRDHPCVDCGEINPVVLQFDHVRGTKAANVAQLIRDTVSWGRIEDEIRKCEVRCVNCHFRRTAIATGTKMAIRLAQG